MQPGLVVGNKFQLQVQNFQTEVITGFVFTVIKVRVLSSFTVVVPLLLALILKGGLRVLLVLGLILPI